MVRPAWSVMSVKSTETAKSETAHAHPLELSADEFRHVRAAARARGAPHAAYDGFVPRDRRQLRVSTRPWTIMPADAVSFWLKPFGFFDRNPALDVPPSPKSCCN
jgi:hypothetical protein